MTDRAKWFTTLFVNVIGLAAVVFGGYLLATEPRVFDAGSLAAHSLHYKIDIAVIGTGLLLLVPSQIAAGIKQVGAAAVETWRAKNAPPGAKP